MAKHSLQLRRRKPSAGYGIVEVVRSADYWYYSLVNEFDTESLSFDYPALSLVVLQG